MRTTLALVFLALAACSATPQQQAPPVLPIADSWAPAPGSFDEYETVAGTGSFDREACLITRDPVAPGTGLQAPSRLTNLPYALSNGVPGIARVWTLQGVAATSVPPGLEGVLVEASTGGFLGEVANQWASLEWPPEPLTTTHPVAGEELIVTSAVTYTGATSTTPYTTRYRTIAVGVVLDGFADATQTCLVEDPSGSPTAYNHIFSGGKLREIYWGRVEPDGRMSLVYFSKIVRSGVNP